MPIFIRSVLAVFLLAVACAEAPREPSVPIDDIVAIPAVTTADSAYVGVYAPLDGVWQGEFTIYEDTSGQQAGGARPSGIGDLDFDTLPLEVRQTISVTQHYRSESPFFQRVRIRDTYSDADGSPQVVISEGVNKVQDGRMWCVVHKPDEIVIHEGETDGPATIIWQRDRREPLAIEYFHETVYDSNYVIKGWGYYGDDDPTLSPRLWFAGEYRRIAPDAAPPGVLLP